jgi:hypothetical protein
MADVDANINISAVGADEASAALGKVSEGFQGISDEHAKLAGKFGERFQHVGLQLFVGEALKASGVGMETRGVLNILNLAINSFGLAMGAAVPYIIGAGAALAVLYGLYQKMADATKKRKDELAALLTAQEKEIQSLNTGIATLESYNKTLGYLPETTRKLLEAKKELRDFEAKEEISNLEKQVVAIKKLMAEEENRNTQLKNLAATQNTVTAGSLVGAAATQGLIGIAGQASLKYSDWNKQILENNKAFLENKVQLAEATDRLRELKGGVTETYDALAKKAKEAQEAAEKASREQISAIERIGKAEEVLRDKEAGYLVDAAQQNANSMAEKNRATELWYQKEQQKLQAWYDMQVTFIANHIKDVTLANEKKMELEALYGKALDALEKDRYAKTLTAEKKMWNDVKDAAASAIDATAKKVGDSFAKMLVEGKSFTDSLEHMWRDMAEMFISEIARMMIKYLAFMALTGGNTASPMAKMFGFAEGGSMLVTKPTLMLAGEGGQPEVATFTPLSKMQSAGGGISQGPSGGSQISIGAIETHVYGVTDPARIADEVGRQIVQRIRGMGEIDFVRAI